MIVCHGCNKPIVGEYIQALGHNWHQSHFVCTTCGKPFANGQFLQRDGKPYCERDYYEVFGKRCGICHEPIRGQYFTDSWENAFCDRHGKEFEQCFTCRRLICQSLTGGGVVYEDGRRMCNLCRKTAVDSIDAAMPLFAQVRSVLAKQGLRLDEGIRIPLRLASEDEIDKLAGGTQQIEAGISLLETVTLNSVEAGRNVKDVVILYGLPVTHASAVLAHEFGHVWCFLNNVPHISLAVQEGICEMFSFCYLAQLDTPESRFHMKGIENNNDPVYGGGFRQIRDAMRSRTFVAMLADLRKNESLV